jgi:hypothetical protein
MFWTILLVLLYLTAAATFAGLRVKNVDDELVQGFLFCLHLVLFPFTLAYRIGKLIHDVLY